jgi:hypothetical protein
MLWLVLLTLGLLMLASFVAWMIRLRKVKPPDTTRYDFSVEQLLRLHRAGQLSAEEFERAKAEVLARRPVDPDDPARRGFEVLPPRRAAIQSLEDRAMP